MNKFPLLLWIAGMPGVLAVSWLALPVLLAGTPLPAPISQLSLASTVQNALLLAIAAWLGAAFAPRVGLGAPWLLRLVHGHRDGVLMRCPWLPAMLGGLAGAALLHAFARWSPPALVELAQAHALPLSVRLLYGGVTEEILVRWGLMSLLLWGCLRLSGGERTAPAFWMVGFAILASALLFGAAHLPVVAALGGPLETGVIAYVVGANAAFGIVAGWLFWRYGLEAAVLAHVLAHVLAAATGH